MGYWEMPWSVRISMTEGSFLELRVQQKIAMHINVRWRFSQVQSRQSLHLDGQYHALLVAIEKCWAREEGSHMTLARSSRSFFHSSPALRCSRTAGGGWGGVEGRLESEFWTHRERLTFQFQLCSVLGKVYIYSFSHIQALLQHCEMNAIILDLVINKLSLREASLFSQGHTVWAYGFTLWSLHQVILSYSFLNPRCLAHSGGSVNICSMDEQWPQSLCLIM